MIRPHAQPGFTLVEAMITLAVLAIVAAVAVPAFSSIIANQRVKAAANDLLGGLTYARSEAIKRNATVRIGANGDWESGWFVSSAVGDTYGGCSASSACLKVQDAASNILITAEGGASAVDFTGSGRPAAGQLRFQVCDADASAAVTRRIVDLDPSGRATVTLGSGCDE